MGAKLGRAIIARGPGAKGWVHNIFACVALRPEVNVNACCNAGIEKFSIARVQINLYVRNATQGRTT